MEQSVSGESVVRRKWRKERGGGLAVPLLTRVMNPSSRQEPHHEEDPAGQRVGRGPGSLRWS